MNFSVRVHCDGDKVLPSKMRLEVEQAISSVSIELTRGASSKIRYQLLNQLKSAGWSGAVAVSNDSGLTITSMKENVGLCLQTGNMARMYADLMKLQTLYLDLAITSVAIILPSYPAAMILGSNIAQATRLERELDIFKMAYNVPTLIFAME